MSLKLTGVSKTSSGESILRGVSLETARGEVFGLLGAQGAGKTTLLRLIYGAEKIDSGEISFEGEDFTFAPDNRRGFALAQHESTVARETENAENLLLLDNPFCCLDDAARDAILEDLRRAAKEKNLCVVFATNNAAEAFAVCDRAGVLHAGEIVQTGTPRELYEKPFNAAVARAMGRVNFIEARPIEFDNESSREFQTLDGEHRLQIGREAKQSLNAATGSVTLHIRPEHISISFGASFPEDNLLKAKIVRVQYQGATTRIKLSAAGLMLEALVLRLVGLHVGDECLVGLPPDRIAVLKD